MKVFRCKDSHWLRLAASALLVLLTFSSTAHAADVQKLWQSRDQFVALDRTDSPLGGAVTANDHPLEISIDRLTAILASIEINPKTGSKPEQLFTKQSLDVLVPEIVQGFRKATPGEDVTFAVIGLYSTRFGLGKSPKVTAGRAFYKGGRLNIIFGLVQNDFNERDDRRLSPFTPGSRQQAAEGEWALLQQPGLSGFTLARRDWVTFSDEWLAAVTPAPVAPTAAAEQKKPAAALQPDKAVSGTRGLVERMTILNELKEKALISEEEYRSKRLELLKEL